MPLILLKITSLFRYQHPVRGAATYCVGTVGNARIRAVPHYGKTGFEVAWQVVPARTGGDAVQDDRNSTDHAVAERAVAA